MATREHDAVKCLVIGAGAVGALSALYAARRGWDVEIYDLRGDIRDEPPSSARSINLALSERGINALRHSGSDELLNAVLSDTVPMYGRMIHSRDSKGNLKEESQAYDVHGRFQRAMDRASLIKIFLSELEKSPNVKIFFHHKLTGVDFRNRKAWIEHRSPSDGDKRPQEMEVDFDIILGCDGAHSSVRYHMMKYVRMNYEQSYIDLLWCEFTIPPKAVNPSDSTLPVHNEFAISPDHLHIWPSEHEMFIAIPSTDKTFTCTLFAPSATFADLEHRPEQIEPFFRTHFSGAADLFKPGRIQQQFEQNPHLPLISVKCSPHYYSSSGVVLGDASHAMVPFYGQGMNAGLEDVRVLFQHLDSSPDTTEGRAAALEAYNAERVDDAHTINDLATGNFWEMHAGVQSRMYLLRKKVEEFLSDKMPFTGFATQYSRISFSNQRYSEVRKAVQRQREILIRGLLGAIGVPLLGGWLWFILARRPVGISSKAQVASPSGIRDLLKKVSEIVRKSLR